MSAPLYREIWDDATTLGKCTIAIPAIFIGYILMVVTVVLYPVLFGVFWLCDRIEPRLPVFWKRQ